MSRFASIRLTGNVARAAGMAGFMDKVVIENCDNNLERSAAELASKMKSMIVRKQCGLASNTELTQKVKGGNIPLVDSSQLVNGITWAKVGKGQAKLTKNRTNNFEAYFVGVNRNAPIKAPSSHIGEYQPVSLYNIAKNQVRGYTVKLPRNGIKKVVPARDFRTAPYDAHKERHRELMANAVASGIKVLGMP